MCQSFAEVHHGIWFLSRLQWIKIVFDWWSLAGPTTAAGMAAAKGWKASIVPSLLVGTLGYAMATFLAVALGINVLQNM